MFEFDETLDQTAKIKVIGVGGGGSNVVDAMIKAQIAGVEFIVANTDAQALKRSVATDEGSAWHETDKRPWLPEASPDVGRDAAMEDPQPHCRAAQWCRHGVRRLWSWRWHRNRCGASHRRSGQRGGCSDRWCRDQAVLPRGTPAYGQGRKRCRGSKKKSSIL